MENNYNVNIIISWCLDFRHARFCSLLFVDEVICFSNFLQFSQKGRHRTFVFALLKYYYVLHEIGGKVFFLGTLVFIRSFLDELLLVGKTVGSFPILVGFSYSHFLFQIKSFIYSVNDIFLLTLKSMLKCLQIIYFFSLFFFVVIHYVFLLMLHSKVFLIPTFALLAVLL